jgi:hypothetical protein
MLTGGNPPVYGSAKTRLCRHLPTFIMPQSGARRIGNVLFWIQKFAERMTLPLADGCQRKPPHLPGQNMLHNR